MGPHRKLALAFAAAAVGAFAYAASIGELRVGFFLVFPILIGGGIWPFIGMVLLVAAFVTYARSAAAHALPRDDAAAPADPNAPAATRTRMRSGGVILLGPIPIVWGSDRRVTWWMIGAGFALLVATVWWALR